ncbi:hypothetical protein [Ruegeria atlantica]|uniref:hypothetical protein n=1 Tax=Ruegeria atlantica TaxID=81569 RepID=UPI00147F2607|nr:hypothetical protein [Ruegeria atlantica]
MLVEYGVTTGSAASYGGSSYGGTDLSSLVGFFEANPTLALIAGIGLFILARMLFAR